VRAASPLLRRAWDGREPPLLLEDLPALPLVDKEMLRASQNAHPPFGDYLAAPATRIARIHRTSGTTGTAMNLALSARDAEVTAIVGARAQAAGGLGPGHRIVHCLNYRLWMGGYTDHATLEATGAAVVPFGVGDTQLLVRTIRELAITAISCTPSYPAVLERTILEHFPSLKPRDLGLRLGLFGGEAGLDDPNLRRRLEDVWGMQVRNANYGVTDVMCNFAGQSEIDDDLHFMAPDVLHAELVAPESGAPLPWRAGETGELVLTHLERECQPLVRFRTGDIVTLTGLDRARCGRTTPRFRVVGRSDDMVVVRGINVFPVQVAAVINAHAALSGEYRIVLDGPGPYDALPVEVELAQGGASADVAQDLAATIKRDIGVTARVALLPFGSLAAHRGQDAARAAPEPAMTATIRTEDAADGVRVLTLNRPDRLNAIVPALIEDLVAALRGANDDPDVRAVVLTGAGRAFCSGADLKDESAQAADAAATRAYVERIQDVTRAIVLGRVPVIAAVRGWAVGGGLEWVIDCDLAIAAQGTRFFFPEIAWGLFVTGGVTALLPRIVGLQRARELILLGERFDAADAQRWGLVHKVVPDDALMDEALALARRIAALPPEAVHALRRCLVPPAELETALAAETDATLRGFLDPETARAFGAIGEGAPGATPQEEPAVPTAWDQRGRRRSSSSGSPPASRASEPGAGTTAMS
jgi:phenylacetate-CoA ligase